VSSATRARYWCEETRKNVEAAPRSAAVIRGVTPVTEAAKYYTSEQLREEITEGAPDVFCEIYSELLDEALGVVNWDEIADHLLRRIQKLDAPFDLMMAPRGPRSPVDSA